MKTKYTKVRSDLPVHYRYVDHHYEHCSVSLEIDEWVPVHETTCTYLLVPKWSVYGDGLVRYSRPKRVLKNSNKRYCYPCKELAFESFKIRKEWQIKHAKRSLARATKALKLTPDAPSIDKTIITDVFDLTK